jgi:Wings apart-like protein regulation of heterochromatin
VLIRKTTLSFLRVSINLTNSNPEICEALNYDTSLMTVLTNIITANPDRYSDSYYHHSSIDSSTEPHESEFDLVLLSLGLMINFAQESDKVKESLLATPLANSITSTFENLIAKDVPPLAPRN